MESWLHFVHVLMAAIWVGGDLSLQVLATRIANERRPEKMHEMAGHFEYIGMRVFTPASLLVLVTGIWLVAISDGEWKFTQFWVVAALAVAGYSFASGVLYLGPQLGTAKKIWDEEGSSSERGAVIMRRLFVVSRIELALLLFLVYDMVIKPFS